MRRKKLEKDEVEQEYEWDIKRIAVTLACIVILLILVGAFFFSVIRNSDFNFTGKRVLGAETSNVQMPDMNLSNTVAGAKTDVTRYLSQKFLSSTSATGKFMGDIGQIRGGKKNIMDMLCDFWCKKK